MAAGILSAPGTARGPCEDCTHRDCEATRMQAATPCGLCDRPIGYQRRLYNDDEYGLVHATCLEDAVL